MQINNQHAHTIYSEFLHFFDNYYYYYIFLAFDCCFKKITKMSNGYPSTNNMAEKKIE